MTISQRQRLRRVGILCCHCLRNLALYRAWHNHPGPIKQGQFWAAVNSNFLDMTVLEWCKLFGDKKGKHCYAKVIANPEHFRADMLTHLGIDGAAFDAYVVEMRTVRDTFIAHLDDALDFPVPVLDLTKASTEFLYDRLLTQAAGTNTFHDAPAVVSDFFDEWFLVGQANYAA